MNYFPNPITVFVSPVAYHNRLDHRTLYVSTYPLNGIMERYYT